MEKILYFIKNNIYILLLILISSFLLAVNIRMNLFSYNNFDFGKFDLGNMAQMEWNTLHGRFLYLTDYFGTNLPRWAMSHVDPILLIFLPIFAVFPHPLTLVFSQLVLVIFSSLLIYKIAQQEIGSGFTAFLLGLCYLIYPAIGWITSKTGFHGVTAAIPFFLGAFYLYENMHKNNIYPRIRMILFWILLIITMSGKEQLPLYVVFFGLFIILFRNGEFYSRNGFKVTRAWLSEFVKSRQVKIGASMTVVGMIWFCTAFFIIIPAYSQYRVSGYQKFARLMDIDTDNARAVGLSNYFLSRYEELGSSYSEIIKNIIISPDKVIQIALSEGKMENVMQTFTPLLFTPFLYPQTFVFASADLLVNYMAGADAGGIAEIRNHRISMIIPVLFISVIYFIAMTERFFYKYLKRFKFLKMYKYVFSLTLLIMCFYTSAEYKNPVYMWIKEAVARRIPKVFAKFDDKVINQKTLVQGQPVKISPLESKDRECAQQIVGRIPESASVSGPDYLGAHLSMRETYAIFPSLYNEADYVIIDVFSKKIFTVLGLNADKVKEVIGHIIKNTDYKYEFGCGNIFVYKKINGEKVNPLLPIQEALEYKEKYDYFLQNGLRVVDYKYEPTIEKSISSVMTLTYNKKSSGNLNNHFMYLTFINKENGQMYQVANLPSFGILQPKDWSSNKYYIEEITLHIPEFFPSGEAMLFLGISDTVKNQSIYLGEINIK